MNRSLLLIVCDFLLLSILALARFDVPKDAQIPIDGQKIVADNVTERKSDGENYDDVVAELEATNETLQSNLGSDKDELLAERERLEAELRQRKEDLAAKEADLVAKQDELLQKDSEIEATRRELQDAAQDAEALAQAKIKLEEDRRSLSERKAQVEQEFAKVSAYLEKEKQRAETLLAEKELTAQQREAARAELAVARERIEAERVRSDETSSALARERNRSDALVASTTQINERLGGINERLDGVGEGLQNVGDGLATVGQELKGVGDQVNVVSSDVATVRTEVADVRQDVAGVGESLSAVSDEIAGRDATQKTMLRNIIQKQPNSLNEIYTRYLDNVVTIKLSYKYRGGFLGGEKSEEFETETILLSDGSLAYALVHVDETPFRLTPTPRRLVSVQGTISGERLEKNIPIAQVAFLDDPRILIIPIINPPSGVAVFQPVANPHVFAEAVVVDSDAYNFGETTFTRDAKNERYVRLRKKFFSFLRGEFQASQGDLVFSKTGQVLGIMVNDDYAFVFKDMNKRIRRDSITFVGDRFNNTATTRTLAHLGKSLSGVEGKFR
jgi:archaellum component FlaC